MTSVSVIIAAFNRPDSLRVLLCDLSRQELDGEVEVIVVDDGSEPSIGPEVGVAIPSGLSGTILRQANAGPGAARHYGIGASSGEIVVIIDDDMTIPPSFLAAHVAAHRQGATLVMGLIREPAGGQGRPLFDRFHLYSLDRFVTAYRAGTAELHGGRLCTGNVSVRRSAYLGVGGFDLSMRRCEDRDLGLRMEAAGERLAFAEEAWAQHCSDHADARAWLRRSSEWGAADVLIAAKHPRFDHASPWTFFRDIPRLVHPFALSAAFVPRLGAIGARVVYRVATVIDRLGREREALTVTTFAYALSYYGGVGRQSGTSKSVWRSYRVWRNSHAAGPAVGAIPLEVLP